MTIVDDLHPVKITINVLSENEKKKLIKCTKSWKIINQSLQRNFDELKNDK